MGKNFRETLNEQLQNPEFKAEWDALKSERQDLRAIIEGDDSSPLQHSSRKAPFHRIEYRSLSQPLKTR